MSHQIYELMVLGMHPAIQYPRRSQFRPPRESMRLPSTTLRPGKPATFNLTAPLKGVPDGLAVKRLEHGCVQARQERARHTIAVFVRLLAGCRMSGPANHNKSEDDPTGPLQYTLHNGLSNPAEAGYYTTTSDLITRAARVWF